MTKRIAVGALCYLLPTFALGLRRSEPLRAAHA